MEIIQLILIIGLFCTGLRMITAEGMIFYFLRKPYEKTTGIIKYLLKPLIGCVTCMASFHGIWIYYTLKGFNSVEMIICCIGAACINTLLYSFFEVMVKYNGDCKR